MAWGGPGESNPWTWSANDPSGLSISISIPWTASTGALGNATIVRDSGCTLGHLYIGLGADGTPEASANAYAVPVGTTTVRSRTLNHNGLNTITDLEALQITAGE